MQNIKTDREWVHPQDTQNSGKNEVMTRCAGETLRACINANGDPALIRQALRTFWGVWDNCDSHRGEEIDFIIQILESCGMDPLVTIEDLALDLIDVPTRPESCLDSYCAKAQRDKMRQLIRSGLIAQDEVTIEGIGTFQLKIVPRYGKVLSLIDSFWPDDQSDLDEETEGLDPDVTGTVRALHHQLSLDRAILFDDIGIFVRQDFPGYQGRNPRTGQVIEVPGTSQLAFKKSRWFP